MRDARARRRGRRTPPPPTTAATAVAALLPLLFCGTVSAQEPSGEALTIYAQDMALVRAGLERPVRAGERTVRIDGLPGNLVGSSLLVLDPEATLLGVHSRRTYQSGDEGGAVSLALDLRVESPLERLRLAYLTRGISWTPTYAMLVAPDDRSARIDGYATISNGSGTSYEDAAVQLLAGTVNVDGGRGGLREMQAARVAVDAAEEAPQLARQAFSGYHLYDVDVPLTLRAGTSRRIRLLGADSVSVAREYVLQGEGDYYQRMDEPRRQEALIRYRVQRPEGTSFADRPLPSGRVRIFQEDDAGRLQLLGADGIPNVPAEEEILLAVGRAFDIGGTRTQTAYERPGTDLYESAWEVELVNRTDEDVVVQVIDRIRGDWEVLQASHEAQRLSAGRVRFDVPVPADGETTLTYRIRVED